MVLEKMFRNAIFKIAYLLLLVYSLNAQSIKVNSVEPVQNLIGAVSYSEIKVVINTSVKPAQYNKKQIFRIYGSNSGLVLGKTEIDTVMNVFIFTPERPFFSGEIIDASFGPLINDNDTLRSFNWRFTIEITNPTVANFDSLSRYNYPSFSPIAIDYNKDGYIDIVSGTGRVLYNDGHGRFVRSEQIPEIYDIGYMVDVNNDGIVDIITKGGTISLGNESGKYSKHQVLNSGIIIATGDVNGDGYIDLISKESFNGEFNIIWRKFINDGTGTFIRDSNATFLGEAITKSQLVDMDNDGDLDFVLLRTYDIASPNPEEVTYVYYNNGRGAFNGYIKRRFELLPEKYESINDLEQLYVIDYDRNGLNDVAGFGSVGGGTVLLQEAPEIFHAYSNKTYFSRGGNFAFFTSGDVNGDNRFDIVVSNYQVCMECGDSAEVTFGIEINSPDSLFNYYGRKSFKLGQRKEVGVAVVPVMADIENDGDLDIIHTGYPTTVTFNRKIITSVKRQDEIPSSFELFQNYPNPFNSSTILTFELPGDNFMELKLYDLLGQEIKVIEKGFVNKGEHKVLLNAQTLSSGTYFCVLTQGNYYSKIKLILIK